MAFPSQISAHRRDPDQGDGLNRLSELLSAFRTKLRAWAVARGVACWILVLLAAAWAMFALDFFLEPTALIRRGLLAASVGALGWFGFKWVASPAATPLTDASLALAFERNTPALGGRLSTAVDTYRHCEAVSLVNRVQQEALVILASNPRSAELRLRSTLLWLAAALLITTATVCGAVSQPGLANLHFRRLFLADSERYPRRTSLTVEGFNGGERKTARGKDATIRIIPTGEIPPRAWLEVRKTRANRRQDFSLPLQASGGYRHIVRDLLEPFEFRISAGDQTTDWHILTPVPAPAVASALLTPEYPTYTELAPRPIEWKGDPASLPVGTKIELRLQFTKAVAEITATGPHNLVAERTSNDTAVLRWLNTAPAVLHVTMIDEEGVESTEPAVFDIAADPDEPPTFARFEPLHVGPAVTRMARLPFSLRITDDYGVEELGFHYQKSASKDQRRLPTDDPLGSRMEGTPAVELADMQLRTGDKFSVSMFASDLQPLDPIAADVWKTFWPSRTVTSPSFTFEVVESDELLARLAVRELNGRRRFEQAMREWKAVRTTIDEFARAPSTGNSSAKKVRLDESLQVIHKGVNETKELAGLFRAVSAEIRNNRCAAASTVDRLETGVARPLEELSGDTLASCDRALSNAVEQFQSPGFSPAAMRARQELDTLLVKADTILQSMMKMENFNELVAALRSVRDEQQKLLDKTVEERKKRILDLVK